MPIHYTLKNITEILATSESRNNKEKLFHQLKGLSARRLLLPIPDIYGQRGALLFDETEIYRARLLLAAVDVGISPDDLGDLNAHADDRTDHSLKSAIAALDGLDDWILELTRIRDRNTGELLKSVNWVVNRHRGLGRVDPLSITSYSMGGVIEAVLSIRFSGICQPIWNVVHETNQ